MVQDVQRQVIPELTRVFGHAGLYLRPSPHLPAGLPGNMLAGVCSLARDGDRFGGDLRCADDALPLAGGSVALVYAMFVLETSPCPGALLAEIARVLRPEGTALFLTLNPFGLARLRWALHGLHSAGPGEFATQVRDAGLDVQRCRYVGPLWRAPDAVDVAGASGEGFGDGLRMAQLLVARRRDPGVTPLRATPSLDLMPGPAAG